jgi:DNA-3-methyladenine glycosylase I
MNDPGIVRNKLKIEATIDNAKAYLALTKDTPFADYIWSFIEGGPQQNKLISLKDAPSQTEVSTRISKALKAEGFRFVGPTTVYAFMQSSGMVNDHLVSCSRHAACEKLQARVKIPGR